MSILTTSYSSFSGTFIRTIEEKCANSKNYFEKQIVPRVAALALLIILPLELIIELPLTLLILPLFVDDSIGRLARNTIGTIATLIKSVATIITGNLPKVGYNLDGESTEETIKNLMGQPKEESTWAEEKINRTIQKIITDHGLSRTLISLVDYPKYLKIALEISPPIIKEEDCDIIGDYFRGEIGSLHHTVTGRSNKKFMVRPQKRKSILETIATLLNHQKGLPSEGFISALIEQGLTRELLPIFSQWIERLPPVETKKLVKLIENRKIKWRYAEQTDLNNAVLTLLTKQFLKQPDLTLADAHEMIFAYTSIDLSKQDSGELLSKALFLFPKEIHNPLLLLLLKLSDPIQKNNSANFDKAAAIKHQKSIFEAALILRNAEIVDKMLTSYQITNDTIVEGFTKITSIQPSTDPDIEEERKKIIELLTRKVFERSSHPLLKGMDLQLTPLIASLIMGGPEFQ